MTYNIQKYLNKQLDPDKTLKEATKRTGIYVYRNRSLIKKQYKITNMRIHPTIQNNLRNELIPSQYQNQKQKKEWFIVITI